MEAPMKSASLLYASELAAREVKLQKIFEETPWLLPKHKIFISHSGRQKDFAEQLCEDLERAGYYPFFDKRSDSLPKGVQFPELIFKAASQCLLAIVILSEDFFTRTKWPMLELAEFVKAQKSGKDLRILPVLLGLSIEDLRSSAKWSKVWTKWGKQDRRLTHNVIKEWEAAVQALKPLNKISKSSYDGEVALRRGIVCSIMEMMPPDVRSDVLHVQGRERLCRELRSKFYTAPTSRICENATVLGVFGIGGAGKSTLCMIITEFVRSEFFGRVCHVELSVETSTVNLQRKVLRQLFRVNEDYLNKHISTESQGCNRLKELMPSQRVFLALDNVSDTLASIDTANMFLRLRFHPNSMVLVTSRSNQVLCRSLGIPQSNCLRCPSITSEEALCILLEQVNLPGQSLNAEQKKVLDQTVERSFFHGYHPMALKVLGAQLGTNPATWRENDLNLEWTSDVEHPLFSAIETNYARLPNQQIKDVFLDIALFAPEGLCTIQAISTWLTDTIYFENGIDDIKQKLGILRAKALLEIWREDEEDVRIHDLYRMLAERMTSVEVSDNSVSRFIYQRRGLTAPKVLLNNDAAGIIERAAFVEAKFEMIGLETCSNLQVLSLRRCENLRTVGIQRLGRLVSLELSLCPLESLDLRGLNSLRWLHVFSCENLIVLDASEAEHLGFLNVSKCKSLRKLNLKHCLMIRLVSVSYNDNLQHVNLGSGQQLTQLTLWFCEALTHVEVSEVAYVTTLKKRGCPRLLSLQGSDIMCKNLEYMRLQLWCKLTSPFIRAVEISTALQVLDIWHCPVSRLPDLRRCLVLQELRLSNVDVLLDSNNEKLFTEYGGLLGISANDLDLPKNLEDIRIESCRNVAVKEVFLKLQGLRHLRWLSLQDVRVGWDWELYRNTDGWHKSTYGRHNRVNFVSDELSSLALEGGFTGGEVEEVSKGWVHEDDEEVIALKRQIDEIHGQISAMGMKSRTGSKAKHLQMSNISGNDEAEFYSLQHEELMGMKANDAGTSSDANHLHSRGAVQDEIEPSGYLDQTMRWIGVFCSGKKNLTQLEQMIKEEIELHWGTSAESSILQNAELQQLFWNTMDKIVEFRGSPCWFVEQIIHATCRSCDMLCEWLWQRQGTEVLQGNQKKCLLERCQKVHVEEIRRQLLFLTAANPMTQQVRWENWERMIVKEVMFRRKTPTWGDRFCEGVLPMIPRLETLGKRLDTLSRCRGWKVQSVVESNKEGLGQVAWDWLWACHLCLSIEQLKQKLKHTLARQLGTNDVPNRLMHCHQMIQSLISRVDDVFEIEVEKLLDGALASVEGCYCDEFDGLVRCWKVRQWLQELELCLSECGVMQGNKRTLLKESIPQINEMCQSITQIGEQLGLMEYFWPVMSEQLATMSGCIEGPTVKGRMADLVGKAALLAVQLRQECPCMELLYVLLDAASKRKEELKENIDIMCQKIDRFLAVMRVELTCVGAQFNFKDAMVIDRIKNILVVVAELRIKQLQYMKFAHCSLDHEDNGRMEDMWEGTKKLAFGLAEEWITIGGERQWIPLADLTKHLLHSNINYTWEWTETLVVKLTEEMQFIELVLYPSQFSSLGKGKEMVDKNMKYPWERVDKLTLLLTNELICLEYMYPKTVVDFRERMNRMVERARRFGLARLVNLLTTQQQLIGEETLRRLHVLGGKLELLRPSVLATDADEENPIGRLSVLVVGGGQKPRGKKGIQRKFGLEFTEPIGGAKRPSQGEKHDSYNSATSTQQVYRPSLKEKAKVMVGKVRGLIVRGSSKKPSVKVDGGEEMNVDMDDDVGFEEDEEELEMNEESAAVSQWPPFVELWDDANNEQLLSLPFSQCTGLRHLCFSNCGLSNPRWQLVGQWRDRSANSHFTLSRIDWVAQERICCALNGR